VERKERGATVAPPTWALPKLVPLAAGFADPPPRARDPADRSTCARASESVLSRFDIREY